MWIRRLVRHLTGGWRSRKRLVAAGILGSAAVLAGVWIFALRHGLPLDYLTRDPFATDRVPVSLGFLSYLGIVGWGAAAAVSVWAAVTLRPVAGYGAPSRLLLWFAALTLLLLADDWLMIHDGRLGRALGLWSENPAYVLLLGAVGLFLVHLLGRDFGTSEPMLVLALGFLGASLFMDKALPSTEVPTFFEDGAKFTGIVFWFLYAADTSRVFVRRAIRGRGPPPNPFAATPLDPRVWTERLPFGTPGEDPASG